MAHMIARGNKVKRRIDKGGMTKSDCAVLLRDRINL